MKKIIGLMMTGAALVFAETSAATAAQPTSGFMPLIVAILLMMLGTMYFTNKKQKADIKEIKEILTTGKIPVNEEAK